MWLVDLRQTLEDKELKALSNLFIEKVNKGLPESIPTDPREIALIKAAKPVNDEFWKDTQVDVKFKDK